MRTSIRVLVEATPKKAFASALDWPGWSRAGRDEEVALRALLESLPRYRTIAEAADHPLPAGDLDLDVTERLDGDASTAYGVPAIVAAAGRRPVDAAEGERLTALVHAAWAAFDRIAAAAPEELRKGPRGGGRDRTKVVAHVTEAEAAYAQVMGRKHRPDDPAALAAMRADILAVLGQPSDGTPLAGKRWPPRYAARRIAWHVLDHAWEIEDRTERG